MSWAGFLFDSTIAWFLLWRRARLGAYVVLVAFHVLTSVLFPIGMFPWIMIGSALLFFPPAWPRRLFNRNARVPTTEAPTNSAGRAPRSARAKPALVALSVCYCVAQLVVPLRFLAYGGDVRWHEQGMRFSWRVMVREKNGSVTFHVNEPSAGRQWQITPGRYLTPLQEREMAGQPDLILQLAHHIRRDFRVRGLGEVAVRAEALVSLNGRRLAPLIDPEVDLTRVSDGLGVAAWFLPVPNPAPPSLRPI
jgi:hypothetical protein